MKPTLADRILDGALALAVLNTSYLAYRFFALRADAVEPRTGLCSLTEYVDCDMVLLSGDARAFLVPNASLGLGFFLGCFVWRRIAARLGADYRHATARALAFWLGIAVLMTFWFFWLLARLPHLCPLCPWNHLLTYVAFGAALRIAATSERPSTAPQSVPLAVAVALSVAPLFLIHGVWLWALAAGFTR